MNPMRTRLGTVDGIGDFGGGGGWLHAARHFFFLALRRLRRVGSQQPVFQRRAVEAADDRLHLIIGGRFDKSEALGFLRFVVSDHFNGVCDKIFSGQPLLDIVGRDPYR